MFEETSDCRQNYLIRFFYVKTQNLVPSSDCVIIMISTYFSFKGLVNIWFSKVTESFKWSRHLVWMKVTECNDAVKKETA